MVQSWLLFHYYVMRWPCILSIIKILLRSSAFFNRIISIHTTTSVSRRFKILCIMFNIIAFFVIVLLDWLYVSAGIFMTFGENLHGRIISLREEISAHKTRLRPPIFIEGTVISEESERSCISMLGVLILPFLWFWYLILKLVLQCDIFVSYCHFITKQIKLTTII